MSQPKVAYETVALVTFLISIVVVASTVKSPGVLATSLVVASPAIATTFSGTGDPSGTRRANTQTPPPDAWTQLASFIKLSYPADETTAVTSFDRDWAGSWSTKQDLGLEPSGGRPCPQSQVGFPTGDSKPTPEFRIMASTNRRFPIQLKIGNSRTQNNCNGVVQTVLYNTVASDCIRGKTCLKLNDSGTLENISQGSSVGPIKLPPGAVVVKVLWEKILPSQRVFIWDPSNPGFLSIFSRGQAFSSWTTSVPLSHDASQGCGQGNFPVSGDQGAPPGVALGKTIPPSCFIPSADNNYVLVGLNIAHKTDDGWYFFAFAWTNNFPSSEVCRSPISGAPEQTACGGMSDVGRPNYLAPWSHYEMNETRQIAEPKGHGTCFNPYLEALVNGGATTNCARCHQFATFVPHKTGIAPLVNGQPVAFFTASIDYGKSPSPIKATQVQTDLNDTVPTDFLWSLVTKWEN